MVFTNMIIRDNLKNGIFTRWSHNLIFNGLDIYQNGENGVFASYDDQNPNVSEVANLHFQGCLIKDNGTTNSHWGINLPSPYTYTGRNCISNCIFLGNFAGSINAPASDSLFQVGNIIPDSSSINFSGGNIATNGIYISHDGDEEGIAINEDGINYGDLELIIQGILQPISDNRECKFIISSSEQISVDQEPNYVFLLVRGLAFVEWKNANEK